MKKTTPFKNLHSREYRVHQEEVRSVAWNFTGTKLASGSWDETARVWSIGPHGNLLQGSFVDLKGHEDSVEQLCWDPKHADLVATASVDKTVRLWDDRTGKCERVAKLNGSNINIAFKPDGEHIAVVNTNNELIILDVRGFKPICKKKFNREVNEIAWNITGDILFVTIGKDDEGDEKGFVQVLSYPSLQTLDNRFAHTAGCNCIAIDPCGRYFAVGSADFLVSLWDISEMLCVRTFTNIESAVRTVSFNQSGEYLASGSTDHSIDIANVQTGRTVHQIPCGPAVNSVDWNPTSNLLAYAGRDNIKGTGYVRIFGFTSAA